MYSGGSQAPLWYFAVVGAQAVNLTFYFSQAMSLTRRRVLPRLPDLAAAISAVGMSAVFVVLGLIEQATDGYGMNGYCRLPAMGVGTRPARRRIRLLRAHDAVLRPRFLVRDRL
jgi:hypothetical protein